MVFLIAVVFAHYATGLTLTCKVAGKGVWKHMSGKALSKTLVSWRSHLQRKWPKKNARSAITSRWISV